MREFQLLKLGFKEPIHLGAGKGEDLDKPATTLYNDTIKGALFSKAVLLKPDLSVDFLRSFDMSASMIYHADDLYFPKPMARLPIAFKGVEGESKTSKHLKKIQFLSKGLFEMVLNNESIEVSLNQMKNGFLREHEWSKGDDWVKKDEIQQRVQVAKNESDDADPFYIVRTRFSKDAGMAFLVKWIDASYKSLFNDSMQLLAEDGIGTDRVLGNGRFTFKEDSIQVRVPHSADHQVLLGAFLPDTDILNDFSFLGNSAYSLVRRGGYMAGSNNETIRHYRKRNVRMFDIGSVLQLDKLQGSIINTVPLEAPIRNIHPVYKDGSTISLPIKI